MREREKGARGDKEQISLCVCVYVCVYLYTIDMSKAVYALLLRSDTAQRYDLDSLVWH